MTQEHIEVCIPTRKRTTSLALTIAQIFGNSTLPTTSVALGVDEDDSETLAFVEELGYAWPDRTIRLVVSPPKTGGLGVANMVLRSSTAPLVLLGVDDMRIMGKGWDRHLFHHFLEDSSLSGVGMYLPHNHKSWVGVRVPAAYSQGVAQFNFVDREGDWVFYYPTLWCMRKESLERVGYYFEGYTKWWSDLDLVCSFVEHDLKVIGCTIPQVYSIDRLLTDDDLSRIKYGLEIVNQRWCNVPFIRKIRDWNARKWCNCVHTLEHSYPYRETEQM